MKIFIRSSSCISAQNTFRANGFLAKPVEYNNQRLPVIEPDYREFIDVKQLRRMSHVIKMGIATAKDCLSIADLNMPGAIITGTAFGCMEDTITFLTRIIEMNEEMLSPTAFVQSTHNTVAAQIALNLKCHNYNNTFVHKGISFESALIDAIMLLKEGETNEVLTGGLEEMADASFKVLTRMGLYKRQQVPNLSLFSTVSKGTIGGEGAAFFLLTNQYSLNALAVLTAVKTIYKPANIANDIEAFLKTNSLSIDDIDLVITGKNGDIKNDDVYNELDHALFKNNVVANYKHLCGEYSTSSAFALWLAANCIKNGEFPPVIIEKEVKRSSLSNILIYNHYYNKYHSLILVAAI
jgi:3-oxoacyl-[acyl-carrier-protein] synthase II